MENNFKNITPMKNNKFHPVQHEKFTVEECGSININELMRKIKNLLKEELLKIELEGLGNNIKLTSSKTGRGGTRYWFFCPQCNKRIGVLYRIPGSNSFQCRHCGNLQYGMAHYHRSPQEENAKLIKKLLRMRKKGANLANKSYSLFQLDFLLGLQHMLC